MGEPQTEKGKRTTGIVALALTLATVVAAASALTASESTYTRMPPPLLIPHFLHSRIVIAANDGRGRPIARHRPSLLFLMPSCNSCTKLPADWFMPGIAQDENLIFAFPGSIDSIPKEYLPTGENSYVVRIEDLKGLDVTGFLGVPFVLSLDTDGTVVKQSRPAESVAEFLAGRKA